MIRLATLKDIDKILEVTKACAAFMIKQGIYQWNEFYPNKKAFLNDFDRKELYVLELENNIIGCITISTYMDREYIPISWLTSNAKNIYIHRLAVHPNFQGKGYAQQLMQFVETFAKNNNFVSVRLDTFSENKRNTNFYEKRKYKRLGEILFPKQSKSPFYCYEHLL